MPLQEGFLLLLLQKGSKVLRTVQRGHLFAPEIQMGLTNSKACWALSELEGAQLLSMSIATIHKAHSISTTVQEGRPCPRGTEPRA